MQLKHFKKSFIMNNEWSKTCKALKELLDILVCSECHNKLHDPHQFLACGHFLCVPCLNNNNTSCNGCQLPNENNDTIQRIAEACSIIAKEIGYKHKVENLDTKPQIPPIHNVNNNVNPTINLKSKLQKDKQNKRKGGTYLTHDHSKKTKWDKPSPAFRIPKNIDKRNHVGETTLQRECKKGNYKNVEDLLKAGADPNVTCHAGWTALQESSDYHHYKIVEILLKYKADINKPGHEGRTALHEAVRNRDKEMIKLLLKHGAKMDMKDDKHFMPIDYCESEEVKAMLNSNNEGTDETTTISVLKANEKSNTRPKSRIQNRVCERDIINRNDNDHLNNASSFRRITRHGNCQGTNQSESRKKTIKDYFCNTGESSTSEKTNYDDLPENSDTILQSKTTLNIDLSQKDFTENLNESTLKYKNGMSKNFQNYSCKKTLTGAFANDNIVKNQQNNIQASTSKIVYNSNESNYKHDVKFKTASKLDTEDQINSKSCTNHKVVFNSQRDLKSNDSDDSEIELVFETSKGPAENNYRIMKEVDTLKADGSSQGSIDVVNTSSCIDTEDLIIDIEN